MRIVNPAAFLRRVLFADAALSSVMALLLIFGASAIASITALPVMLLSGAGWALVPWVALVMFSATREPMRRGLVWAIVALNAVWATESVALLFMESIHANALGTVFVLAQALVVAVLAVLQAGSLRALRQASPA
jgi:hypothetical protein